MSEGKRAKVEGEDTAENPDVMMRLEAAQDKIETLKNQSLEEILEVEKKYIKLCEPHYEARSKIIEEMPDFWLTAIQNHPMLGYLLTDEDEKCLKFLSKVEVKDKPDLKSGYSVYFHFRPNPYFSNATLAKHVVYDEEGVTKINNSGIQWKDGMNLCAQAEKKQSSGGKRNQPEATSFFLLFESEEEEDSGDAGLADVFKEELFSNPVKYFNGTFSEDGDVEELEFDEDEEEEDEEGLE